MVDCDDAGRSTGDGNDSQHHNDRLGGAEVLGQSGDQRYVNRDQRGEDDLEPAQRFLDALCLRHKLDFTP